ncbi:MAG: hypothetical protein CHACPFDD_01541 [Phycisphaerae bacterium]|nr:hypothetical protein [Phycisphaerae bacterium]
MRAFFNILANSDRWLLGLLLGLLAVAVVCGLTLRDAAALPKDKILLTICRGGYKPDRDELRAIKAAFEAANPDIHLNLLQTSLERKTDTMIAAGVAPDLIYVLCDNLDYYVEADALLDLTPHLDADPELKAALFGGADGTPPDFFPQTVQPLMRNGRLYVMPVNYNIFVVFYLKDLFDKYHVPYPTADWDWEGLRQRALALTRDDAGRRPDQPGFDPTRVVSYGFHYAKWQHGPETFIRQNGGRLVSEDGTRVVADDPRTVEALEFLSRLKYVDRVCPPGQVPHKQDIGITRGTLGMFVYGIFGIPRTRAEARNLDWDIAPLPRGPDGTRASIVYTNAWGVSKQCRHPEAALRFLKFMVSPAGVDITSQYQVFMPARRSMLERTLARDPDARPASKWVLTHDIEHGYAQPPFFTRQYYMDVYECINDQLDRLLALDNPPYDARRACELMTTQGNRILQRDRPVRRSTSFGMLAVGLAAAPAVLLLLRFAGRRKPPSLLARREERWGYALVAPWLLGFLVFAAGPILVSFVLSFAQWQSLAQFTRSEFIGAENYRLALSGSDPKFWVSLWVTFRYALLSVPAGLVAGVILAVMMNQRVPGITLFRTLYYIPAVLPAVATAVLWWHLFDANHGWVNRVIELLNVGGWIAHLVEYFGQPFPITWLESKVFTPYIFVVVSLWTVGGGMIIYLAGLQNIPTQLYEAAEIDGAGRWARFVHVTLPMLSPVILFNLVMGIIGSFQVFNLAFVIFDGFTGPADSALFYGLHLFREAFFKYRLGYASALAWILFSIILAFTALVFKSSPLWVHYEAARGKRA